MKPYLAPFLIQLQDRLGRKSLKILNIGCGNSLVGEDMWKEGWGDVINIDFSPAVIELMINRHKSNSVTSKYELSYKTMDATDMKEFPTDSFDVGELEQYDTSNIAS